MNTAVKEKKQTKNISTKLTNINEEYLPLIVKQMTNNNIKMTAYAKECVLHAISSINALLDKNGIEWNSPSLDTSTVSDILIKIACLRLNAAASPREVYFQLRRVNKGREWIKQVEMGIESDGNDALLANFGRGITEIKQIWKVREKDDFTYPTFNGLDMDPPKWTPKGQGKIVKIVYPIIKKDSEGNRTVEFYIAEREDVSKNLYAHIANNLMNETFGIAESRYKASAQQKAEIDEKKRLILNKAKSLSLDAALDDKELSPYISPAWKDYHSREAMIERKMRNNAIKKIPKDFGNGAMETMFEETTNEQYKQVQDEVNSNAASLPMDIEQPTEGDSRPDTGASNEGGNHTAESKKVPDIADSAPKSSTAYDDIVDDDFRPDF